MPMQVGGHDEDGQDDLDADPAAALALRDLAQDPRTVFRGVGQPAALAGHPSPAPGPAAVPTLLLAVIVASA